MAAAQRRDWRLDMVAAGEPRVKCTRKGQCAVVTWLDGPQRDVSRWRRVGLYLGVVEAEPKEPDTRSFGRRFLDSLRTQWKPALATSTAIAVLSWVWDSLRWYYALSVSVGLALLWLVGAVYLSIRKDRKLGDAHPDGAG